MYDWITDKKKKIKIKKKDFTKYESQEENKLRDDLTFVEILWPQQNTVKK